MPDQAAFTIRSAQLGEFDELCRLWEVLDERHRVVRPDMFRRPIGDRRRREDVASLIAGPDSTLIVADAAGRLLGLSAALIRTQPENTVRAERRFAEVDNIVVAPDARRLGVATALIDASAAWARERGFGAIGLSVFEFNAEALAFYEAVGFKTVLRWLVRS